MKLKLKSKGEGLNCEYERGGDSEGVAEVVGEGPGGGVEEAG